MDIRATRVFTAIDDEVIVDGLVRIEGARIVAVGRAEDFGSVASVTAFDGTILPGLVDSHAHPSLPSDRRPLSAQALAAPEFMALTGAAQLGRHLAAGYTTVMDCGAKGTVAFAIRDAATSGLCEAPSLLVVGRPITQTGGHMSWCGSQADGPTEIAREVSVLTSQGADAIKIIASGGGTGGIATRPSYSVASLQTAVEAAHDQGLPVIAHCRATEAITRSLRAGIDVIAHLEFLEPGPVASLGGGAPTAIPRYDERVGEALASSNAYLDLNLHSSGWDTLIALRAQARGGGLGAQDRDRLEGLEHYYEAMLAVVAGLAGLGLGARMSFGSDAGPFDTEFGHPEYNVELARLGGLSAAQSIQVITRNAARAICVGDEVGTLEPGKRADLVVVSGDPLVDPSVLASPRLVLHGGRSVGGTSTGLSAGPGGRARLGLRPEEL